MKLAFYKGKSVVSRLIRFFTWGAYSHVAPILDDGRIIEAWHKPNGVRFITHFGDGHAPGTRVDIFDIVPPLPSPEKAMEAAEDMEGMRYDFAGIIGFITRRGSQNRRKVFCSEAAMILARAGGVELLERVPAWKVSPSMLSLSPLLKLSGYATTGRDETIILSVLSKSAKGPGVDAS